LHIQGVLNLQEETGLQGVLGLEAFFGYRGGLAIATEIATKQNTDDIAMAFMTSAAPALKREKSSFESKS
jgi:hypothetical protein